MNLSKKKILILTYFKNASVHFSMELMQTIVQMIYIWLQIICPLLPLTHYPSTIFQKQHFTRIVPQIKMYRIYWSGSDVDTYTQYTQTTTERVWLYLSGLIIITSLRRGGGDRVLL